MNLQELWGRWGNIHDDPDQKKRIESAKKANMTPISIDQESGTGEFAGSANYHVSLDCCNCGDFHRRSLPCKHIYRLAAELRVLDIKCKTDTAKIRAPKGERVPLSTLVSVVEDLNDNERIKLRNVMKELLFHRDSIKHDNSPEFDELIGRGFLVNGSNGFGLNTKMEGSQKPLYTYLLRRDETDEYYDPDKDEFVEIPYGAVFSATVSLTGSKTKGGLKLSFPDDNITYLLDKYGKNRCNDWNK